MRQLKVRVGGDRDKKKQQTLSIYKLIFLNKWIQSKRL